MSRPQGLTVLRDSKLVWWYGVEVPLTKSELKVVAKLFDACPGYLTHAEIYDTYKPGVKFVGNPDDVTGGKNGNSRTLVKRIRNKFRSVDPAFDAVESYSGLGYRWVPANG